MIPYGRQDITQADIDAVVEVLNSEFLTQGPNVPRFEQGLAEYCGSNHAVAVNSATSALHVACLALGLGEGDWLWTSPVTFVASANCGLYCGAKVDFVDIDPATNNMCPKELERKLVLAESAGRLPKVVVPVHLCGQSCDMAAIHALSVKFGFKIIEDASHAVGGRYRSAPIGKGDYSDITILSFHPVKIITTAEGGAALTNSIELARRMELFRSHGVTRDTTEMGSEPDGAWYYEQIELGFNYRMTEIQAALGLSQLQRLDDYVSERHRIARRYNDLLGSLPVVLPVQDPNIYSGLHLYVIRLQLDKIRLKHREVFDALRKNGIGVNLHYIPVHLQPFYRRLGFRRGDFSEAERYYGEAISLPMYPLLSDDAQDKIVAALVDTLS